DQLGDDAQAAAVGRLEEVAEVFEVAVIGVDVGVVGDVVAVVLERRGVERQQPQGGDAEILEIVEAAAEAAEVADAVGAAVLKRPDVDLINDGVLVPEGIRLRDHRCYSPTLPMGDVAATGVPRQPAARTVRRANILASARPLTVLL